MTSGNPRFRTHHIGPLVAIVAAALVLGACQTDGQTGALIGAGVGAAAGQALGNDTEATLIGAGAGAIIGGVIGNESEKNKQRGN